MQGKWIAERKAPMFVKLLKLNPQNFHIDVENTETGQRLDLTCPMSIFQRLQKWGPGTLMEVEAYNDVVKNVVRQDPLDSTGAYR